MQKGQRFSQQYLERGEPTKDSARMRSRLGAYFEQNLSNQKKKIASLIHKEIGVAIPMLGAGFYSLAEFFETAEMRDLLDSITLIYKQLCTTHEHRISAGNWMSFVNRVFKEENVGYQLDEQCGVHYFIDEEFERNKASTITILSEAKEGAILEAFEKSHIFLDQEKPDTISSIRSIFEALEILYKKLIDSAGKDRLNKKGVESKLKPLVQENLKHDEILQKASDHMLDGMIDWIEAGHMYRHGQKTDSDNILAPPLDYTVLFISHGAAYIRFLLAI